MTSQQGNFLEAVPEADIYILRMVLHDWDDQTAELIPRNIRFAASFKGSSVLLVSIMLFQRRVMEALSFSAIEPRSAGSSHDGDAW